MENVSSDAGIKATQAVKFPLPGGNYTNYRVVKILCKYRAFLSFSPRSLGKTCRDKFARDCPTPRIVFSRLRLVLHLFTVILNSTAATYRALERLNCCESLLTRHVFRATTYFTMEMCEGLDKSSGFVFNVLERRVVK